MPEQMMKTSEALNAVLYQAMLEDSQVICIGEDIAENGGVFGVTQRLASNFGPARVIDTPISETAFVGMAVGSAMTGLKPVVEIMFCDFIGVCLDQIMNQAAKARFLSGGRLDLPLVIRTTMGAGDGSGAMHSASLHGLFASISGLTVICPSSPADAAGLLRAALKSKGPVIFIENKNLYDLEGPVPHDFPETPIGVAKRLTEGTDVTIVAIGQMTHEASHAAALLGESGISAEVLDPRTVKPLDVASIITSVGKTGRLVVVDEGAAFAGFADAVIARVAEQAFSAFKAAPKKVCPPDTPVPYAVAAEEIWLPNAADIVAAVQTTMEE